jgi:hypothetical protein
VRSRTRLYLDDPLQQLDAVEDKVTFGGEGT